MIVALFESDNIHLSEGLYFVNTDRLLKSGPEKELNKLLVESPSDNLNPIIIPPHMSFTIGAWGKEIRTRILVNPPFPLEKIVYAIVEE